MDKPLKNTLVAVIGFTLMGEHVTLEREMKGRKL